MRILLDVQSDREPIEYTHFDMWFCGEDCGPNGNDIYKAPFKARVEICEGIIASWEQSLGVPLHPQKTYNTSSSDLYRALDIEGVLDLVILKLLEHGYDVYSSENMIEIYEGDELLEEPA